jgi:hypothetical protein
VTGEVAAELAGDAAAEQGFAAAGGARLPRVLPPVPVRDLGAHQNQYGPPGLRGPALIGEAERSGLTGRGGRPIPWARSCARCGSGRACAGRR